MRFRSLVLLSLLGVTPAACRRASDKPPLPADPIDAPISIMVVNHQPLPVEVFVVGGGVNHRLGTVHPGMRAHFSVPPGMVGSGTLELEAHSADNRPARSGPLLLSPGAIVDFTVVRPPYASTAAIRQ